MAKERGLLGMEIKESDGCKFIRLDLEYMFEDGFIICLDYYDILLLYSRNLLQYLFHLFVELRFLLLSVKKKNFSLVPGHLHLPYFVQHLPLSLNLIDV